METRGAAEKQIDYLTKLIDRNVEDMAQELKAKGQDGVIRKVSVALKRDVLAQAQGDRRRASRLIDAAQTGFVGLIGEIFSGDNAAWVAYVKENS